MSNAHRLGRSAAVIVLFLAAACSGSDDEPSPTEPSPTGSVVTPIDEPEATTAPETSTAPDPADDVESVPPATDDADPADTATDGTDPAGTDPDRPLVINGPATVDPDEAPTTDG
ncbi:hypothetical protein [Ilumatobacter coccineus]|uniref:Uncharacterized protein n=1 Tax=Ilumatobacter coccineus (strain NBRC 103263 / KCTC 29153 / YM16-304) TaxID=1313172 RepID=A0A6C7E2M2_ILUCY|nr:hypothetical protein [Ilumatobacter coccineus]BAN01023.1 hypothetical protein YM304_07090 [Ilumatobacter coccineus YM16-304]